jgi:hypothetical protein
MRSVGRSLALIGVPLLIGCATRRVGGDDLAGKAILLERRYAAPHAAVFTAAASAIIEEGYAIRVRDSSEERGRLVTHPRHTWIECLEASDQAKVGHPGIEAAILTERKGDSTVFRITANTLSPTQLKPGLHDERVDIALPLELCTMAALAKRVDSILSPNQAAPGRDATRAIVMPLKLGDFALADTQHFSLPGAGTGYRYRSLKGLRPDVYVYPVDLAGFSGDTAAALQSAVGDFLKALPVGRARGQFTDFEVRTNAVARRTIAGDSLLVHRVVVEKRVGSRVLDDYFHIAVVGDNYVKVRTTFDRGVATEADVERFVGQLLQSLLGR